jgi:hypothetical protein
MSSLPILAFQLRLLKQLTAWSLLSIFAGGLLALLSAERSFWQAFGGMNAAWGLVNLLIASAGLFGVLKKKRRGIPDEQAERRKLLRLLKVNVFLDVGYVLVGLGMVIWGRSALLHGFGWGIILQGAFLLLFDAFHYKGGSIQ